MKILLLGAAGFIGTNLTIELAKKTEDEITLVDRSKAFFKPIVSMDLKNVHILEADLTVDMDFDSILKDQEVVYHLVSTTVPTTSNQHISQELVSNVIFSANLFEACIRCGVKKVVFVSSGGTVYGKEVDCPLKEKTATNPISSYGVQKITMHVELYHKIYDTFNEKYADVKQRLIPDAEVPYRFHFTPEDFYVFVIAHAYKHYSRSGTGIRTLADIYIMNQKLGGTLNWEYVDSELRGLGIFSYEHESRELAQKIFGIAELPTKANLSEAEQQMLAYYLGASTYGTIENRILNQMQKLQPDDGAFTARTKRKYLLSRIFPGREWCKAYAPTVYKYPVLLPFFWVWRLIYKGITNRKKVTQEIKTIKAGKQN